MAGTPCDEVENKILEKPGANEDEFWPLSGKPYFSVILSKSHVERSCKLLVPLKIHKLLPSPPIAVVLSYCGKSWETDYVGDERHKRFDLKWKTFVVDNNLKIEDACVFELTEFSKKLIKFRVQILRGDLPSELLARENGETSDTPIVIE